MSFSLFPAFFSSLELISVIAKRAIGKYKRRCLCLFKKGPVRLKIRKFLHSYRFLIIKAPFFDPLFSVLSNLLTSPYILKKVMFRKHGIRQVLELPSPFLVKYHNST